MKWGLAYSGVGDGWCFTCGGFAGHVKLMFINGAAWMTHVTSMRGVGGKKQ